MRQGGSMLVVLVMVLHGAKGDQYRHYRDARTIRSQGVDWSYNGQCTGTYHVIEGKTSVAAKTHL